MSARVVIQPRSRVTCDHPDYCCPNCHEVGGSVHEARRSASQAGWQVRPWRGRGSRVAPDYCPEHRTESVS